MNVVGAQYPLSTCSMLLWGNKKYLNWIPILLRALTELINEAVLICITCFHDKVKIKIGLF